MSFFFIFFFFFNDTATTEIYTLSLHDALPISRSMGLWTTRADQHQAATPQVERAAVQAAVPSQGFQTGPSHEGEELVKGAHADGGGVLGARTVAANEGDVVVDHVTREVPDVLVEHDRAVRGLLRDLGPETGGEPVPVQGLKQEAPTRPEGLPDAAKGLDVVLRILEIPERRVDVD